MATEIDNKVVSMQFDNRQFEQNVQQSLGTIQRLKDSLNLDQSAKSLTNIENKMNQFNPSGMSKALNTVGDAFTVMGQVGQNVISRLTNDVINLGQNIVSQLTRPIREGMQTYEQQIKATQTTMNALNLSGSSGEAKVRTYLKDLNKYSDETIYRFSDMTTSLGKFVSAGVDINDATEAIKGLGNVAALSGADTMQFSRAIYNISQSLGMGKLITRDWMSIENANMATKEFKETLIDTAKEMGYMDKEGKLTSKGLAGVSSSQQKSMAAMNINYKNFRDSLSGGWLKNDVLMKALKTYADETTALGKKGKAAATEVKTFSQLIDTLGDSLATKWSNIYTDVVGDFQEAKEFWTGVSNVLDTLLTKPLEKIEKVLSKWKEIGGRSEVLNGLKMQLEGFKAVFEAFKMGWEAVFPPKNRINTVWDLTKSFKQLSYQIGIFLLKAAKPVAHVAVLIASALKIVVGIVKGIATVLQPIISLIGNVILAIFKIAGAIGDLLFGLTNANSQVGESVSLAGAIANILTPICGAIGKAINFVADSITNLVSTLKGGDKKAEESTDKAEKAEKKVNPILGFFIRVGKLIGAAFKQIGSVIVNCFDSINNVIDSSSLSPLEMLYEIFAGIANGTLVAGIAKTINKISSVFDGFGKIGKSFAKSINKIGAGLASTVKSFGNVRNAKALKEFAIAVAILAGSFVLLASVKQERIQATLITLGILMGMLGGMLIVISKITNATQKIKDSAGKVKKAFQLFRAKDIGSASRAILLMAISVGILASAMAKIGQLDLGQMIASAIIINGTLFAMVGVLKLMSIALKDAPKMTGAAMALSMLANSLIAVALAFKIFASIDMNTASENVSTFFMIIAGLMVGMTVMAGALKTMEASMGSLLAFGGAMLMFAPALIAVALAFKIFSTIDMTTAQASVEAFAMIIVLLSGVLMGVSYVAAQSKLMMATMPIFAASMVIFSVAMVTMAAAFKIVSTIDWNTAQDSIIAFTTVIGLLSVVMMGVSAVMADAPIMIGAMPVFAASMVMLGVALIAAAAAFKIVSTIDWNASQAAIDQFTQCILGLMAAMTIISALMSVMPIMIGAMPVLAASMVIFSVAMNLMATSFAIVAAIDWKSAEEGIEIFVASVALIMGVMGVISAAMAIFPVMIGAMPVLAASLVIVSAAMLIASTAFVAFAGALAIMAAVDWDKLADGVPVLWDMTKNLLKAAAIITIFPLLTAGLLAIAAVLKVFSVLFGSLGGLDMMTLGENFCIMCKKMAEGLKALAKEGKKGKAGIEQVVSMLNSIIAISTMQNQQLFYDLGSNLMQNVAVGMISQQPALELGMQTVTASLANYAQTGGAVAYVTGAYIGDQLIQGFRGPGGIDDPIPYSDKANEGLDTIGNSLTNYKSILGDKSLSLGNVMGTDVVSEFGDIAGTGVNDTLSSLDGDIDSKISEWTNKLNSFNSGIIGVKSYGYDKEDVNVSGRPMVNVYKDGKFLKQMTPEQYKKWAKKHGIAENDTISDTSKYDTTSAGADSSSKSSKSSKSVSAAEWGYGAVPKGFKLNKTKGWRFADYFKFGKTYEAEDWKRVINQTTRAISAYSTAVKNSRNGINARPMLKRMTNTAKAMGEMYGTSTKKATKAIGAAWVSIYRNSDEYKENVKKAEKLQTKVTKSEKKLNAYGKQRVYYQKMVNKYENATTANGKAQEEAYKQLLQDTESNISSEKSKLEGYKKDIKSLTKEIEKGPNKAFKEMYDSIKDSVKEASKITDLTATVGLDIFSHFQYGGTKKQYKSGKQGHYLSNYSYTQAQSYDNWKSDYKWLIESSKLSKEVADYFKDLGYSGADTLHALRYAADSDIKQINQSFTRMVQDNSDTLFYNYKLRKERIQEWGDKLVQLAEKGLNPDAFKELMEQGYSDDSLSLMNSLLGLTPKQLKNIKSDSELVNETTQKAMSAYATSYGLSKKDIAKLFSFTNDATSAAKSSVQAALNVISLEATEGSTSSKTYKKYAKQIIKWIQKDAGKKNSKKVGKYLTEGLAEGILSPEVLEKLVTAAEKAGRITLKTIKKTLKEKSPSRETFKMGVYLLEGLARGIDDSTLEAIKSAQSSALSVLSAMSGIDTSNIQPTIAPVIDQNSLLTELDQISGLMTGYSAQLASEAQYQLKQNKAIQNYNISNEYDDSDLIKEIQTMHDDMLKMQSAISGMQVTMDTGALVGQIVTPMDNALGKRIITGRR